MKSILMATETHHIRCVISASFIINQLTEMPTILYFPSRHMANLHSSILVPRPSLIIYFDIQFYWHTSSMFNTCRVNRQQYIQSLHSLRLAPHCTVFIVLHDSVGNNPFHYLVSHYTIYDVQHHLHPQNIRHYHLRPQNHWPVLWDILDNFNSDLFSC